MKFTIVSLVAVFVVIGVVLAVTGQKNTTGLTSASTASQSAARNGKVASDEIFDGEKIVKTEAEWKKTLTREAFYVLREKGTERPYTGALTNNHKAGTYACAACGLHLFRSKDKFDSGTGWPSFFQVLHRQNVDEIVDNSLGETRTEVNCARCGSHLGHVFDDGPQPTGLRYCINSVSLKFLPGSKVKQP